MKPFTLSKKSWVYWLANFPTTNFPRITRQTNICNLIRAMLFGLFHLVIVGFAGIVVVALIGSTIWNIYDMIFNGASVIPPTIVTLGVVGALAFVVLFTYVRENLRKRAYQRMIDSAGMPPAEPGFLALAYRRIKDKTCFNIEFVPEKK